MIKKRIKQLNGPAFSLVEMLMALLVASLLLAALAPVMTKKFSENVNVTGSIGTQAGTTQKIQEIEFNSLECSEIKVDSDGSEYCEGEFEVPRRFNGYIKATVISAGGGGGVSPTAGYTEYTTAGSTNTFTVPSMTGNIEATLISGGAGGGAGGQAKKIHTFVISGTPSGDNGTLITAGSDGTGTWRPPEVVNNKYVLITACGGGGGGGAGSCYDAIANFGNSGHGAYFANKSFRMHADASLGIKYRIGGGGAGCIAYSQNGTSVSNGGISTTYVGNGCPGTTVTGAGGSGGGVSGARNCCVNPAPSLPCINAGGTAPNGSGAGSGGRGGKGITEHVSLSGSTGGGSGSKTGFGGAGGLGSHSACSGGGGGGSTWLGDTLGNADMIFQVGGGGGGTAPSSNWTGHFASFPSGGGGGGGGGMTGYAGGKGADAALGNSSYLVAHATSGGGATSNPVFGTGYCLGGVSSTVASSLGAVQGKNGAMRITYLDCGPGGSGGGAGGIVPLQKIKTIPNELLTVGIANISSGRAAGSINSSGSIISPAAQTTANFAQETYISRNSTKLLRTNDNAIYGANPGCAAGTILGSCDGIIAGKPGQIHAGNLAVFQLVSASGFFNANAKTANNTTQTGNISFSNASTGGDGGTVTTPFTGTCTPGAGGTASSPNGKNASGYGCGGGGGYGLANGGSGSGGYARISWNKYWDTASNAYKLASVGAGGGGASGNVFTYNIQVKAGELVKIRIGKGGEGAYVINNTLINAKKGGDTVFGDIKAKGGNPGDSVSINSSTGELINGVGGVNPDDNICVFKTLDYSRKNKYCTKGLKGNAALQTVGGKGANFVGFTYTKVDKEGNETKSEIKGEGGKGGTIDAGDNANGASANGIASGGGGASIRDLGNSAVPLSNITNNPTKGGNGANGKIILEWWE